MINAYFEYNTPHDFKKLVIIQVVDGLGILTCRRHLDFFSHFICELFALFGRSLLQCICV
jgi:hypothetical protein